MFKNFKIRLLTIITLLFICSILRGTHIVGGDITYKFVHKSNGNITYHFTLKVYRDLFGENPSISLDDYASISIYSKNETDNTYTLYGDKGNNKPLQIPLKANPTSVTLPQYPCFKPPNNIGVEVGFYEWDATLEESNSSYIIAYQRCCRNVTISNIDVKNRIGSTYFIEITPESQKLSNSSPEFTTLPPLLICGGEPLNYNHVAADLDGDQLVYTFCSPLLGGSDKDAKPEQPAAPPYQYATFIQPQYNTEHPLGGTPNVTIDPNTGLITGIPNTLGQFVVSVCVAEYRNGKLLGKMFRDFQFNVVNCQRTIVTKVVADSIALEGKIKKFIIRKCENAPLTIQNESFERANINSFYWEFNINGEQKRFLDWSPTLQNRDTGVYLGKLVLNPELECRDSAYIRIEIGGRLNPSFSINYDTCVAGSIKFVSKFQPNALKDIVWDYGDNSKDKGIFSTTHTYDFPGIKRVNLSLTDKIGCKRDTNISFVWQPAPPILIVEPDKFTGCAPVSVTFLNHSIPIDSTYKISWDFGDGHFGKTISPRHLYEIADTYSIKLQIVSPLGCKKEAIFKDWIKIRNTPKADFDFPTKEVTNLNPSVAFNNKSSSDVTLWRWDFGIKGYSSRPNPSYSFKDTGTHTVTLRVINNEECSDTISYDVRVEPFVMFNFPNAFTPNNDAKNDEFKGKGFFDGLKSYQMTIRSRWGDVVFQTNNPDDGWNGLKGNIGEQVPDGVYMYEVIYVTPKNERFSKRDFVTIIR